MGIRTLDILKLMIRLGERPWSAEQPINRDVVELICGELYFEPVWEKTTSDVDVERAVRPKDYSSLPRRPLVVTIMGHVDHGKTTLLDALRGTNVAAGEAGGITQKVSIFQSKLKSSGQLVTFMDTPGHAAFAAIRERGTDITDVACLVVAADDGVQDQTLEAIEYLRKSETPFFVAVTKVDKNGADAEAVYMQLLQEDVQLERFGGDVGAVEVSARSGAGLENFEDSVMMMQETVDPRSDFEAAQAEAAVIETSVNRYTGLTVTALVQWGTLRVGDALVAGTAHGRVKSMASPAGQTFREATPGTPVVITGLSGMPSPGDVAIVVADDRLARKIAENRAFMADKRGTRDGEADGEAAIDGASSANVDGDGEGVLGDQEGISGKVLNILIKADVEGTVEALRGSLEGLPQSQVALRFVRCALGEVSAADVELAASANAMLVAFNVRVAGPVRKLANTRELELLESDIIYSVLDRAKGLIENLLDPQLVTSVVGQAEVLQCFPLRVAGSTVMAAGMRVQDGHIRVGDSVRVLRNNTQLFEGRIKELKVEKKNAKEVVKNMECGVRLEGFDEFKPGDVVHSIQSKMQKPKIAWGAQ